MFHYFFPSGITKDQAEEKQKRREEKYLLTETAAEQSERTYKKAIEDCIATMNTTIGSLRKTLVDSTSGQKSEAQDPATTGKALFATLEKQIIPFSNLILKFNAMSEWAGTDPWFIEDLNKAVREFRKNTQNSLAHFINIIDKLTPHGKDLYGFTKKNFEDVFKQILHVTESVSRLTGHRSELDPNDSGNPAILPSPGKR